MAVLVESVVVEMSSLGPIVKAPGACPVEVPPSVVVALTMTMRVVEALNPPLSVTV